MEPVNNVLIIKSKMMIKFHVHKKNVERDILFQKVDNAQYVALALSLIPRGQIVFGCSVTNLIISILTVNAKNALII